MNRQPHEDFRRVRSPFVGRVVRLRAMEDGDIPRVNELFWDPGVQAGVGTNWPEPVAGTRAFVERARANADEVFLAIERLEDDELLGACSLFDVHAGNRAATLGIWIARPFWDRGYGTDAVRVLCRFAFEEMNLRRVELGVFETNPRAKRAYERVGFREEGRRREALFIDGRYVDVVVMGLLAGELVEG